MSPCIPTPTLFPCSPHTTPHFFSFFPSQLSLYSSVDPPTPTPPPHHIFGLILFIKFMVLILSPFYYAFVSVITHNHNGRLNYNVQLQSQSFACSPNFTHSPDPSYNLLLILFPIWMTLLIPSQLH